MSQVTTNYSLPYPEQTDKIDIAGDIKSLAEAIDTGVKTIEDDLKLYTDDAISKANHLSFVAVDQLPEINQAKENVVYSVPNSDDNNSSDKRTEYILVDGAWEIWGSSNVSLDGYVTYNTGSAVGSNTKPIYINGQGVATASTATVGSTNIPVYMSNGTITSTGVNMSNFVTTTQASTMDSNTKDEAVAEVKDLFVVGNTYEILSGNYYVVMSKTLLS